MWEINYPKYIYTGFMKKNLVALSVQAAIASLGRGYAYE